MLTIRIKGVYCIHRLQKTYRPKNEEIQKMNNLVKQITTKRENVMKKQELLQLKKCLQKLNNYCKKDECSIHHHDLAWKLVRNALKAEENK